MIVNGYELSPIGGTSAPGFVYTCAYGTTQTGRSSKIRGVRGEVEGDTSGGCERKSVSTSGSTRRPGRARTRGRGCTQLWERATMSVAASKARAMLLAERMRHRKVQCQLDEVRRTNEAVFVALSKKGREIQLQASSLIVQTRPTTVVSLPVLLKRRRAEPSIFPQLSPNLLQSTPLHLLRVPS